jgi:hypothetical protein
MPLHCNEASDGYGAPPKVSLHVVFLARCGVMLVVIRLSAEPMHLPDYLPD